MPFSSRRQFLSSMGAGASALLLPRRWLQGDETASVETVELSAGDLKVLLRDNSQSPKVLSGVDALFNVRDAPGFDAFDPEIQGASAGLNFEHIISGHKSAYSRFSPRRGTYPLVVLPGGKSAQLVRKREDSPWAMSSTFTYTLAEPHSIDVDFQCVPHDRSLFGKHGYAILFFANYMNDVEDVALHFRGIEKPDGEETWIAANSPNTHADWNMGGTYRSAKASPLEYDDDHNTPLNLWSYDYPRFTKPFYYGRSAKGMVYMLMFDKLYTDADEIRFSLFKFKLRQFPRPAWDFQYVIRNIQEGQPYGFKARAVWKKFVSPEDCIEEYESWARSLHAD